MKKINVLNILISFVCLVIYLYFMIKYGNKYVDKYTINMLYYGAFLSVFLVMFSFFKIIRDSFWMDIIYMSYVLLFILGIFISDMIGKSKLLYGMFICYPVWFKYILMTLLLINIIGFILVLKEDNEGE